MSSSFDIVDGWEVRCRTDGSYGVYDDHGLISGPFGLRTEAMRAALELPKRLPRAQSLRQRSLHAGIKGLLEKRGDYLDGGREEIVESQ